MHKHEINLEEVTIRDFKSIDEENPKMIIIPYYGKITNINILNMWFNNNI